MEKYANLQKEDENMVKNHTNYLQNMKKKLYELMGENGYTVNELAEKSDLNVETVKAILYHKNVKSCTLTTAIKLAKAFDLSVSELVATEEIEERIVKNMKIYRSLPESSKALVDWMMNYQKHIHEKHSDERILNIMLPICNNTGDLKRTNDFETLTLNLDGIGNEIIHKVFMGIKIPCEHYLPHYLQGEILLIANDREAIGSENTVLAINDNIMIAKRIIQNGEVKYYGIRDGKFRYGDSDSVFVFGYIAYVIKSEE